MQYGNTATNVNEKTDTDTDVVVDVDVDVDCECSEYYENVLPSHLCVSVLVLMYIFV